MWLLKSKTIELNLYYDNEIPKYAILSHAWGKNEVSLQQIKGSRTDIQNHAGYTKIQRCCQQAAIDGFDHVWIDTCCIDKTNSAELSEAINSMFKWYRDATECYVYLADVTSVEDLPQSRWFTRGWTLQELLAPESAVFFNKDWQEIGTKACLAKEISVITKIPTPVLLGQQSEEDAGFSVAQVMSWAANRQTTRKEDIGYSLLGIFGVNMPMIYGEGENAFLRLQHEIIKESTDQSLFAWTQKPPFRRLRGAFAQSPADFVRCGSVLRVENSEREFTLTNKGLRIEVDLVPPLPNEECFTAFLNCRNDGQTSGGDHRLGIFLHKINADQYVRAKPNLVREYLFAPVERKQTTTILITGSNASLIGISKWKENQSKTSSFAPSYIGCKEHGFLLLDSMVYGAIGDHQSSVFYARSGASALFFAHESKPGVQFLVVFGTTNFRVWADIETMFDNESLRQILWSYFDNNTRSQTTITRERHPRRNQARESLRDRVSTPLPDGLSANVALKKAVVSDKTQYLVNISIA